MIFLVFDNSLTGRNFLGDKAGTGKMFEGMGQERQKNVWGRG